jgi:Cu+-exporting ATPase
METDPVCGMKVPVTSEYRHAVNGSEAVFCSARCRDRFASDPSSYLSAEHQAPAGTRPPTPPVPDAPAKAEWVCPMHPEIVRDGPGTCPICGMALEPKAGAAPVDAESHELRDMKRRFWFAAAATVPLLVLSMGDMLPGQPISDLLSPRVRTMLELLLATPVCTWAAWPFYVRAAQSVKHRASTCSR